MTEKCEVTAPESVRRAFEEAVRTTLDVRPEAEPSQVREQILRRLLDVGLIPPLAWAEAIEWLAQGRPLSLDPKQYPALFHALETRLAEEVRQYAEAFFTLPLTERERRWRELAEVCSFSPSLRCRLRHLKAGLGIPPQEEASGDLGWLMRSVCASVVAGPVLRQEQLSALRRRADFNRGSWRRLVKQLHRESPEVAALLPDLPREKRPFLPPVPRPTPGQPRRGFNWAWLWPILGIAGLASSVSRYSSAPTPVERPFLTESPRNSKHSRGVAGERHSKTSWPPSRQTSSPWTISQPYPSSPHPARLQNATTATSQADVQKLPRLPVLEEKPVPSAGSKGRAGSLPSSPRPEVEPDSRLISRPSPCGSPLPVLQEDSSSAQEGLRRAHEPDPPVR